MLWSNVSEEAIDMCGQSNTFLLRIVRAVVGLSVLLTAIPGQSSQLDMSRQKVIDERTNEVGVRTIIAVDPDDTVHVIDIGLAHTKGPVMTAQLGTQVSKSGDLELSPLLPKGKVATLARRVTLGNGAIIHVIVAWGFPRWRKLQAPYANLYIFRELRSGVERILSNEVLGIEIEQFIVEDINGDGITEILLTEREAAIAYGWIYQIEPAGDIRFIQRIDAYYVHTNADRWMNDDEGIYVEDKDRNGSEYIWSPKAHKFILEH